MRKIITLLLTVLLCACGASSSQKITGLSANISEPGATDKLSVENRLVSYTENIDLKVSDRDDAKKEIMPYVTEIGGYMVSMTEYFLELNIPAARTDEFAEFLDDKIGSVRERSKSGRDITDAHDDLSARLDALHASRDRYNELAKRTTNVEELLKIEKEIERINKEIKTLELEKTRSAQSIEFTRVRIRLDDSSIVSKIVPALGGMAVIFLLVGLPILL
ncbi:MAG: DUF4349 domain-containing protein [Rickettsiales bacterium]|jgi:uncharacterized coiled-coil DUF342 family protein|nr:DUF4349 domain-containing protein [Rickettsiales bacterium]